MAEMMRYRLRALLIAMDFYLRAQVDYYRSWLSNGIHIVGSQSRADNT